MFPTPAAAFGLEPWAAKLVLIAITLGAAIIAFSVLAWLVPKLADRVGPGTDPEQWRQRRTAFTLLSTALRYVVLVVAVIAIIVILAGGGGVGALGGSAVVAIVIGFASQRLLADVIAGLFILFEGQYGVGDLIRVEPSGITGAVEEVGVRTTILRDGNGDRCYIPNGQITAVRRFPSARTVLSVTLLTRDPDAAEAAIGSLGELAAADMGISAPESSERREIGDGLVAVHARVGAAAALIESARALIPAVLRARLGDVLAGDPVVAAVEARESERPDVVVEP